MSSSLNSDPLEKDIETYVARLATKQGIVNWKFTAPGRRGVPDRLFIAPGGRVFFIEFKRKGKKPTPRQWREIQKIRKVGGRVFIVDDKDEGRILLEMFRC